VIKTIYLAARNPNTTPEQFLRNWREHAELSATFPSLHDVYMGIAQCIPILDLGRPDLSTRYDGVNLLPVRGVVDALEIYDDPNIQVMLADELRVFANHVADTTLVTVETVFRDGPITDVVLLEFVQRRAGVSQIDFIKFWMGVRTRRLQAAEHFRNTVRRFVNDLVIVEPPQAAAYDGVSELWFDDIDQALAFIDDPKLDPRSMNDIGLTVAFRSLFRTNLVWNRQLQMPSRQRI
jgi:hypothetical protein